MSMTPVGVEEAAEEPAEEAGVAEAEEQCPAQPGSKYLSRPSLLESEQRGQPDVPALPRDPWPS